MFAAWGLCCLELSVDPVWSLTVVLLLFPTTVSLFACFLSVNTLGKNKYAAFSVSLLTFLLSCILPTDIKNDLSHRMYNVCVRCTRANSPYSFLCCFSFQGIYKYLERCFSDFKQRGFVVGYDTRGQVTSNCSSKKYEY